MALLGIIAAGIAVAFVACVGIGVGVHMTTNYN